MKPQVLIAFLTGFLFSIGLAVSGMTQPQIILNFLTISPNWDPSLLFVMAGAIPVHWISYRFVQGRSSPLFDVKWHLPTENRKLTRQLILGSILFGMGWGLGGYCPGPAFVSAASGNANVLLFVFTMTLGTLAGRRIKK